MTTSEPAASSQARPRELNAAGEYLSFQIGAEEYGIDILAVQEIRGYEVPTHIANAPAYVLGVLNLRGVIAPILDLRIHSGLAQVAYDALTVTIVLRVAGNMVGMVVDSVADVVKLRRDQINPIPGCGSAAATEFVNAIATIDSPERRRMLILLDIEQWVASCTSELPGTAAQTGTPPPSELAKCTFEESNP